MGREERIRMREREKGGVMQVMGLSPECFVPWLLVSSYNEAKWTL